MIKPLTKTNVVLIICNAKIARIDKLLKEGIQYDKK